MTPPDSDLPFTKVSNLTPGMKSVNVTGKVIEKSATREVLSRWNGQPLKVATAVVKDETGSINLTLWNDQIDTVAVGDVVQVFEGRVREFRGNKQLSVGKTGKLTSSPSAKKKQ